MIWVQQQHLQTKTSREKFTHLGHLESADAVAHVVDAQQDAGDGFAQQGGLALDGVLAAMAASWAAFLPKVCPKKTKEVGQKQTQTIL